MTWPYDVINFNGGAPDTTSEAVVLPIRLHTSALARSPVCRLRFPLDTFLQGQCVTVGRIE
jgi:hypothetical protein